MENQVASSVRPPHQAAVPQLYQQQVEDEISLYDVWNVLVRRRLVILCCVVLAGVLAVLYAMSSSVRYEYRSGLNLAYLYLGLAEVGAVEPYHWIESPEIVEARLKDLIIPAVRREWTGRQVGVPSVKVETRGAGRVMLLTSTVPEAGADQVERLHSAIADRLAEHSAPIFEREMRVIRERYGAEVTVLEETLSELRKQLALLEQRQAAVQEDNAVLALIDAQRASDLRREIVEVRDRLVRAQTQLASVERASRATGLGFLASRSEEPIGPSATLMLSLMLVLGLAGGVLLAFIIEFIANARGVRERDSERAGPRIASDVF